MNSPAIVLFDGVCNLCNHSVRLIFANDPAGRFRFAPLQSEVGQRILSEHGMKPDLYSVLLIDGDKVYDRSSAALRIAQRMRPPWPALGVFLILPRPIRDGLYNIVARVRYRIWGRSESCPMPPPGLRERFLSQ